MNILQTIRSWFSDDLGYILEPIANYQDLQKIIVLADWLKENGGEHAELAAEVLKRAVEIINKNPTQEQSARLVLGDLSQQMKDLSFVINNYLATIPAQPLPPDDFPELPPDEPIPPIDLPEPPPDKPIPPVIGVKKLGYHVSASNKMTADAVKAYQPNVAKIFGNAVTDMNWVNDVKNHCPNTFFVGRLFEPNQEFVSNPKLKGKQFAEKILSLSTSHMIDAWESYNEVVPSNALDDLHKKYDEFQFSFCERLNQEGLEAIAFNFGTGHGSAAQWLRLYPATLEKYIYLGFHEYDWPYLLWTPDNWLSLRYRRIMNEGIRQKYNDKHIVIITECGVTQGVHGGGDLGYLHDKNTIPNRQPDPPMPLLKDTYYQSLLNYNTKLNEDTYVLGACLFVVGSDSGRWETFEHLPEITKRLENESK